MSPALPFRLAPRLLSASAVLACVLLAPATQGQAAPAQNVDAASQLAPGTTICAVLEKTVDAKKAKTGDAIVVKTTMAVLSHGKVVIASGARIMGHVTEAKAHSKSNAKSELGIAFDGIVLKGGGEIPLETVVQAVGYGGLPRTEEPDEDASANPTFPPAAAAARIKHKAESTAATGASANANRSNPQMPRLETAGTPTPEAPETARGNPALDARSKGVVGLNGLTLTEGTDSARGSVIVATKKNVKLERGSQLILRVINTPGDPVRNNVLK